MQIVKLILVIISFVLYLVVAVFFHLLISLIKPSLRWPLMSKFSHWHIRSLGAILGLKVSVSGDKQVFQQNGHFFITRHVSYLDGIILGGLIPGIFVSKREVRLWPLIGQVIALSGTIFIDREKKAKIYDSVKRIENYLNRNINIVLFPEGTSTDGSQILPFHTAFFEAPLRTGAGIIPLIISYGQINGKTINETTKDVVCWHGDMDFMFHLWNLLSYRNVDVNVKVLEKVDVSQYEVSPDGRKALTQRCYDVISKAAGFKGISDKAVDHKTLVEDGASFGE